MTLLQFLGVLLLVFLGAIFVTAIGLQIVAFSKDRMRREPLTYGPLFVLGWVLALPGVLFARRAERCAEEQERKGTEEVSTRDERKRNRPNADVPLGGSHTVEAMMLGEHAGNPRVRKAARRHRLAMFLGADPSDFNR